MPRGGAPPLPRLPNVNAAVQPSQIPNRDHPASKRVLTGAQAQVRSSSAPDPSGMARIWGRRVPIWILVTVSAALFQCWRTALQQKLRHLLSVNGAGFVRFLYGAPTALLLLVIALAVTGLPLPVPNTRFVLTCVVGGLTQILATNLLIMAFGFRNFAVGTAYSKTDAVQSAVIALIVLHEVLRPLAWAGIALG